MPININQFEKIAQTDHARVKIDDDNANKLVGTGKGFLGRAISIIKGTRQEKNKAAYNEFKSALKAKYGDLGEQVLLNLKPQSKTRLSSATIKQVLHQTNKIQQIRRMLRNHNAGEWEPGNPVTDKVLGAMKPEDDTKHLSMAITIAKNGQRPQCPDYLNERQWQEILSSYENDPTSYTACHDVSSELNKILGTGEPITDGGVGPRNKKNAVELVKQALDNGPCVIHVKYAHPQQDGHSFTLIGRPDGKVETMEAWAVRPGGRAMDLFTMMSTRRDANQAKQGIDIQDAKNALDKILLSDPGERENGLNTLSRAGSLGGFESGSNHPDEMSLEVTIRPLDTPDHVNTKMEQRMGVIRSIFN